MLPAEEAEYITLKALGDSTRLNAIENSIIEAAGMGKRSVRISLKEQPWGKIALGDCLHLKEAGYKIKIWEEDEDASFYPEERPFLEITWL